MHRVIIILELGQALFMSADIPTRHKEFMHGKMSAIYAPYAPVRLM